MRESKKFAVENLRFDWLMSFLDQQFQQFSDTRAGNAKYQLAEVIKSAFAMFSLKSPPVAGLQKADQSRAK